MSGSDEYKRRKHIDFAQAEGRNALPSQMNKEESAPAFRARLWAYVVSQIKTYFSGNYYFERPWDQIVMDMWVYHTNFMIDEYKGHAANVVVETYIRPTFVKGDYLAIYGTLQYIIRHKFCPVRFSTAIQGLLVSERAAFRVVNGDTFVPFSSDEEIHAIERAFANTAQVGLTGAQTHLCKAADAATNGQFSDSVRESIHAVESVARSLAPSGKLSDALFSLERKGVIHKAMKRGFDSLYGYTSDEKGIRHPLLNEPTSPVNEADAIFMLGACAAFVSYMINRAREAGLTMDASS